MKLCCKTKRVENAWENVCREKVRPTSERRHKTCEIADRNTRWRIVIVKLEKEVIMVIIIKMALLATTTSTTIHLGSGSLVWAHVKGRIASGGGRRGVCHVTAVSIGGRCVCVKAWVVDHSTAVSVEGLSTSERWTWGSPATSISVEKGTGD